MTITQVVSIMLCLYAFIWFIKKYINYRVEKKLLSFSVTKVVFCNETFLFKGLTNMQLIKMHKLLNSFEQVRKELSPEELEELEDLANKIKRVLRRIERDKPVN